MRLHLILSMSLVALVHMPGCASDQQQLQAEVDPAIANNNASNNLPDSKSASHQSQKDGSNGNAKKHGQGGQQVNNAADENFAGKNTPGLQNSQGGDKQNGAGGDSNKGGVGDALANDQGAQVNSASGSAEGDAMLPDNALANGASADAQNSGAEGQTGQNSQAVAQTTAATQNQAAAQSQEASTPPTEDAKGGPLAGTPQTPAADLVAQPPLTGSIVMYVLSSGTPIYDQPSGKVVGKMEQGDHPLVLLGQ